MSKIFTDNEIDLIISYLPNHEDHILIGKMCVDKIISLNPNMIGITENQVYEYMLRENIQNLTRSNREDVIFIFSFIITGVLNGTIRL